MHSASHLFSHFKVSEHESFFLSQGSQVEFVEDDEQEAVEVEQDDLLVYVNELEVPQESEELDGQELEQELEGQELEQLEEQELWDVEGHDVEELEQQLLVTEQLEELEELEQSLFLEQESELRPVTEHKEQVVLEPLELDKHLDFFGILYI